MGPQIFQEIDQFLPKNLPKRSPVKEIMLKNEKTARGDALYWMAKPDSTKLDAWLKIN